MHRLLVVEDDPSIQGSLVDFFAGREFLVRAVATHAEAKRALAEEQFSLVLLDLQLPDGEGLDVLRAMRRGGDATPVIVLTARGEEAQRVRGLQAGADDYVVKPFSVHELLARIEAVLRRSGAPAVRVRLGDAEIDLAGYEVRRAGNRFRLVHKEAELLGFLLRNPGRTFSRDELLRAVWGFDQTPTTRTVDTHVFNLRKKVEVRPDAPQHLLTVHGVGYRLVV